MERERERREREREREREGERERPPYTTTPPRIHHWSNNARPSELKNIYFHATRQCFKGRGMCYPVCGMVHIKDPLLLIKE